MKRQLTKGSAYTERPLNKEHGFTLFSNLLALVLISLSVPFLIYLFQTVEQGTAYDELSVNQFFDHFHFEFLKTQSFITNGGGVQLKQISNREVLYEKYKKIIRRRVNGEGHEEYLRNVKEVTFTHEKNGIFIEITTTEGQHYEKYFMLYTK
ncbi:MAG TPA: competence type IV pilus minor pilin ComGF [Bacillota bacterium]|nr:competence type IV pilus minor pilin ComGF [Bacillota bacterium]